MRSLRQRCWTSSLNAGGTEDMLSQCIAGKEDVLLQCRAGEEDVLESVMLIEVALSELDRLIVYTGSKSAWNG